MPDRPSPPAVVLSLPWTAAGGAAVVNERGERLRAVWPGSTPAPRAAPSFALALVSVPEGVLLVRNAARNVWELPGGWIDAGESPADCALRELREEAGRDARIRRLAAWIELQPVAAGASHASRLSGAVFAMEATGPALAITDGETIAACGWPPGALPADTSAIDAWLVAHLLRT